jgi:hypothetical protein
MVFHLLSNMVVPKLIYVEPEYQQDMKATHPQLVDYISGCYSSSDTVFSICTTDRPFVDTNGIFHLDILTFARMRWLLMDFFYIYKSTGEITKPLEQLINFLSEGK